MTERVRRVAAPLALLLWAGWAMRGFLAPGLPIEFDAHSHLARAGFVAESLAEGRLPWWGFQWYGGWRLLEFYPPAYFVLVGGLGAVTGDVVMATKGVLFAAQLATALLLYGFARRLDLRTLPALLVAGFFVESAQRGWVLGTVGNHPTVLVLLFASAYLWLAARPPQSLARGLAGRALLLAAMVLAHLQALFLFPALLGFEVLRAREPWHALGVSATALLFAAVLTAFLWLPMLRDVALVGLSLDVAGSAPGLETGPLRVATGLAPVSWEYFYVRDHGLGWVLVALAAGVFALLRRERAGVAVLAGAGLSALAVMGVGERAVLGLGLFLGALCGLAPSLLSAALPGARVIEAGLAGVAIALLAGLPGTDAHTVRYADPAALDVYASLPKTSTHSRTLDLTPRSLCLDGFYGSSSAAPLVSGRPVVFGAFPQGAPLASYLGMALLSGVEPKGALSEASLDALYLAHVGFLVERSDAPHVRTLNEVSPVVFAPHLETLPDAIAPAANTGAFRLIAALEAHWRENPLEDEWRDPSLAPLARTRGGWDREVVGPALAAMALDRRRARAARLFVDGAAPESAPPGTSSRAALELLEHRESAARTEVVVRAPGPGWLRLAYAWDPRLDVQLDGRSVRTLRGSLGGVLVPVSAGTHSLELRAGAPVGRVLLLCFCALLAGGLLWLSMRREGPGAGA